MLFRIIILLIIMLALPNAYIYYAHVRKWTARPIWRLLYFLPSVLLLVYMLIVLSMDDMTADHQPMVGTFMIVFLMVLAPATLFSLFDGIGLLVSKIIKSKAKPIKRVMKIVGMTIGLFSFILLGYGYFFGRNRYVVHQQTFYFKDLPPAFDGYRMVLFSDMHIGTLRLGHEKDATDIVNLINQQKCDVILFAGDLVNHQACELDGFERDLSRLKAPDGVFAVMGNHDYSMYIRYADKADQEKDKLDLQARERSYGWRLLLNEHELIRRGNDSIAIIGVENDGRPPFPSLGDLPKARKGLRKGVFSVLLSHDPTHWRRSVLPDTDIQLTLSGHTHAGQFKVFGWSPVAFVYDEWSGAYTEGNQLLNISDGIGAVMFPFRFGAWPEVNVITLRKAH